MVQSKSEIDFFSDAYRDTYSRINAIVIEGEKEAYNNFAKLAELLPEHERELTFLAKIEAGHSKSFVACGQNLNVTPDLEFARQFFADLCQCFATAASENKIATCLLIQALVIECFAISAYNVYIPVADAFAKKITEAVVKDEYSHLNFGEVWLKANFESVKAELQAANRQILPIIWRMLNQVEQDTRVMGMPKSEMIKDFLMHYGEALSKIGFTTREVMQMSAAGLA